MIPGSEQRSDRDFQVGHRPHQAHSHPRRGRRGARSRSTRHRNSEWPASGGPSPARPPTPDAKAIVEPVFGQIDTCRDAKKVLLRGLDAAEAESVLIATHNTPANSSTTPTPAASPTWQQADHRGARRPTSTGRRPTGALRHHRNPDRPGPPARERHPERVVSRRDQRLPPHAPRDRRWRCSWLHPTRNGCGVSPKQPGPDVFAAGRSGGSRWRSTSAGG